jgi:hypothetical protein
MHGVTMPAPLPTDLAEAHGLILRQREELALAEARASSAEAMVAYLKLMIAKHRREQFGQSSERGRKLLDRLELQLEELEADATETAVTAEGKIETGSTAVGSTAVESITRRRPVRAPLPAHLPRERVVVAAPCACPACGSRRSEASPDAVSAKRSFAREAASFPSSAKILPRPWRWCRDSGR